MQWLDRFIDVTARRPSGAIGRMLYRESRAHRHGFELLKRTLKIGTDESVLEVGCGGGVLLSELLQQARCAAAIDHSEDMVELAKERNSDAITNGRLDLRHANVYDLPWGQSNFDAVASSHMFFFIYRPEDMLNEVFRVLKPGGRFIMVTGAKSLRSRLMFWPYAKAMFHYSDTEMKQLFLQAGFVQIQVNTENAFTQLAVGHKPEVQS